jgi:hypothetical protein
VRSFNDGNRVFAATSEERPSVSEQRSEQGGGADCDSCGDADTRGIAKNRSEKKKSYKVVVSKARPKVPSDALTAF